MLGADPALCELFIEPGGAGSGPARRGVPGA